MKKEVTVFLLLLLSISYINAAILHPASNVLIKVGTTQKSLDSASGSFADISITFSSPSLVSTGEHDAGDIWVSVKDGEKNLIDALKSTNRLCPKSSTAVPTGPADKSKAYHLATEIILSSGKTLQQAINSNDFCSIDYGKSCPSSADSICMNFFGIVQLDGSCMGASYKTKGTDCNTAKTNACNGAGYCQGWSGNGCGNCPFGSSSGRCLLNGNQGRSKHPADYVEWPASWTYSTNPQCEQSACCWWQLICINPRCPYGYDWQIKP